MRALLSETAIQKAVDLRRGAEKIGILVCLEMTAEASEASEGTDDATVGKATELLDTCECGNGSPSLCEDASCRIHLKDRFCTFYTKMRHPFFRNATAPISDGGLGLTDDARHILLCAMNARYPKLFAAPCLLPDAVAHRRDGQVYRPTRIDALRAGDEVMTGAAGTSRHKRIARVWRTPIGQIIPAFEPAAGCLITGRHPILDVGGWVYAENARTNAATGLGDATTGRLAYVEAVYNLELEGHIDSVLLGASAHVGDRVVAACIGKYCGEECDGWSRWTRKTSCCDAARAAGSCAKCDVAVHPELSFEVDFRTVDASTLLAGAVRRYAPY